jgi:uncharacterized membrane protein YfcA
MGVYRYLRMNLADLATVRALIIVTLPLGALGAVASQHVPMQWLRIGYGAAMLGVTWILLPRGPAGRAADRPCPCLVNESENATKDCAEKNRRRVHATDGQVYEYCALGLPLQRVFSGFGAALAGMISTGVGEATLPALVRRSRFPVPVAAATSTLVVAGTVVGAAATQLAQLALKGGFAAIPWNLIAWAVPGSIIGAAIGTRFQGKVNERATRIFFSLVFLLMGTTFLLAFTLFAHRFGAT